MIYNINLGIGWASSGVEYAQAYRASLLRQIGRESKFVFMDMIRSDHIEQMTENIGFLDEEVIWIYLWFTDFKMAPVSFTETDLEKTFLWDKFNKVSEGKSVVYHFGDNLYAKAYRAKEGTNLIHRVEYVSRGCLIQKDYFSYGKMFSEFYAPKDGKAELYQRTFFNEDGSVAYDEYIDGDNEMFRFPDRILYSKQEFVGYFIKSLKLTSHDVLIMDRSTDIGQSVFENANDAKIGVIIHADHFSENHTDEEQILWNNYYEYEFGNHARVDFYVSSTQLQTDLLQEQFAFYCNAHPRLVTIPVGALKELKLPQQPRIKHGLITASRLAAEKHIDWIVSAVEKARHEIPDLTLDIYGYGGELEKIKKQIETLNAGEYVRLCGHQKLDDVYCRYEAYIAASTSEGFGLTLLEAIGSGLPLIGFDVRYGNPTFIDDGETGCLLPYEQSAQAAELIDRLAKGIVRIFTELDTEQMSRKAYVKAAEFLEEIVADQWDKLLGDYCDTAIL